MQYKLLEETDLKKELPLQIKSYLLKGKKVLVEFITKTAAAEFYRQICEDIEITCKVRLMTGEDNSIERNRILMEIAQEPEETAFLLIATQVIEAGVDLQNIEVGFKDISTLDSEEQFMGRVNRSCQKDGIVHFFNLSDAKEVYRKDIRSKKELTLLSEEMRLVLEEKNFRSFYRKVFQGILQMNQSLDTKRNIEEFYIGVGKLNLPLITERMYLIEDNKLNAPVFIARKITLLNGETLDGRRVWEEYCCLLQEKDMNYAKWKVKLSYIKSEMSYFIYQISKQIPIPYNMKTGEIYYIADGEQFFDNGKLNREKFENQIGIFL